MPDAMNNGSSAGGIRRRTLRSPASWRDAPFDHLPISEFTITPAGANQNFLDTITAYYRGAPSAGAVRWFRSPESATVTLVVRHASGSWCIDEVLDGLPPEVDEVVVVGGHWTRAAQSATGGRPEVRFAPQDGPEDGGLVRRVLAAATGDIIVMIDSDDRIEPREIGHFLHYLANGYDFVKGSRFVCGAGSTDVTGFRRLGMRCVTAVFRHLYRANLSDLSYLAFAVHRRDLQRLDPGGCDADIAAELTICAVRAGMRVAEVPIRAGRRETPKSPLRTIRDGSRLLGTVLRSRSPVRAAATSAGKAVAGHW